MLQTCSLKLENHKYVVNMTLAQCADSKELRQTAITVNSDFGIKLSDTNFAFCERRFVGFSSLAMIIANSLQNGIFITDKLGINNKNDQTIWLCIFKDGKPLVNISLEDNSHQIVINGDQLLSKDELLNILPLYIDKYKPQVFTDLAFAIDDSILSNNELVEIKSLLQSKRNSSFQVKRIHNKNQQTLVIVAVVLFSLVGYFSYNYYTTQPATDKLHNSVKTQNKNKTIPKISADEQVLKLIQKYNLDGVLKSIDIITNELPIVIAGWTLQDLTYNNLDSNYIIAIYNANNGQNIIDAKASAIKFLNQVSADQSHDIKFINNSQTMQIKIKFPPTALTPTPKINITNNLQESTVNALITPQAQVQTIADLQSNFFNYRLGVVQNIAGSYSKQDISILNINTLELETFRNVAARNINLAITSITALYSNGVPTWSFKGEIYA
jgi:hypothetical protein